MFQTLHHAAELVGRVCTLGCCPDPQTDLPSTYITIHHNAASFLRAVGPWLLADEEVANTILPHTQGLSTPEPTFSSTNNAIQKNSNGPTVWIACWSLPPHPSIQEEGRGASSDNDSSSGQRTPHLAFAAMSGTSHLGVMPIFIFSPRERDEGILHDWTMRNGMREVIERLVENVPPERICSTFGRASLANAFAAAWEAQTGQMRHAIPWRRRRMLSCSSLPDMPHFQGPAEESAIAKIRAVEEGDVSTVADICHSFSLDNSPSPLMLEESLAHASHLVSSREAWVYEIQDDQCLGPDATPVRPGRVVSLCEVGRRSQHVAVITKIFTLPAYRRNGYAVRLLSEVMRSLFEAGISTVIIYAAHDLLFEHCIFTRTGFDEFDDEDWVEWGFNDTGVSHW